MKGEDNTRLIDLMCAAVEIKEKMKAHYGAAAGKCSDDVGTGAFKMLEELEAAHLDRLREIQAELSRGGTGLDSCRFYDFEMLGKTEVMRRIVREKKFVSKACLDDVAAIESGMDLENKSINYFMDRLKAASDPAEREFLNHLIAEERAHYIMLADLKFYYVDPGHWLMEKGRTDLDGAGGIS
ncbi:MAG: hypothetical protein WAW37_05910 [Syntrophobacteraceae bacterium]